MSFTLLTRYNPADLRRGPNDDTIIIITPRPAAAGLYRLLTGRHQSAKQFPFPSAIEPGTFCRSWWCELETVAHGRARGRVGNLATFLVILNFKLKCNKLHRNLLPISKSNLGIFVFPGCRSGSTLSLLSTEDKQLHLQNKPVPYNNIIFLRQ